MLGHPHLSWPARTAYLNGIVPCRVPAAASLVCYAAAGNRGVKLSRRRPCRFLEPETGTVTG
jgi:hypothetical protein